MRKGLTHSMHNTRRLIVGLTIGAVAVGSLAGCVTTPTAPRPAHHSTSASAPKQTSGKGPVATPSASTVSEPGTPANTPVVPAPAIPTGTYTVRAGDTLSSIAARFGVTWQELAVWNDTKYVSLAANAGLIRPGWVITVTAQGSVQVKVPTTVPVIVPVVTAPRVIPPVSPPVPGHTLTVAPVAPLKTLVYSTSANLPTFIATNGVGPYTYSATGLPNGLTIDTATGAITGSPLGSGTFPSVEIEATDQKGATGSWTGTLRIDNQLQFFENFQDEYQIAGQFAYLSTAETAYGSGSVTWAETGLPAGMTIEASTGVISGTPTTPGLYPVEVTATDADGQQIEGDFNLPIDTQMSVGAVDQSVGALLPIPDLGPLPVSGGTGPYTYSLVSGDFSGTGITFNAAEGTFEGIPSDPGSDVTIPITIQVTDAYGQSVTSSGNFVITSPSAGPI